jgi:uncharacterized repeat protein (TIGR02543 family)
MKYLFFVFVFIFVIFLSCDNDIPLQDLSIEIDDILFIGQQAYINTIFSPYNTTERNLLCYSSDENILTVTNSGIITPKSKGVATITVRCQNGTEANKTVVVYQIVNKSAIISESEQWGPFEKIGGVNSYSQQEIGINTGVEIIINPNTLIENVKLIISNNGKLTTENCEKENTKLSNVIIESKGEFLIDNITIIDLKIDNANGQITNCDFLATNNSYGTLYVSVAYALSLEFSGNIFRGKCLLSTFSGPTFRNNLFISEIEFFFNPSSPNSCIFQYNTIDINTATILYNRQTPNIDLANNYWGTTDTSLIDNFIIDRNDSLSISYYVNYLPILNEKPELSKYTVIFETNSDFKIPSITNISGGAKINKPNDPIKQNYQFIGWFIDQSLETEWDFQNNAVEDNLILYAKWKSTLLYQYEVTNITHIKSGANVLVSWTNPTDINFSHVRIIPAGFEWAESMGASGLDKEPGISTTSILDYANTEYIIIKCVDKTGNASEGIKYFLN